MKSSLPTLSSLALRVATAVALCLAMLPAQAQKPTPASEGVTKWWPDVKNNLVWTGSAVNAGKGLTYTDAMQACSTLVLDGMSAWRLPTIDQLDSVTVYGTEYENSTDKHGNITGGQSYPDGFLRFNAMDDESPAPWALMQGPQNGPYQVEVTETAKHATVSPTSKHITFCVRTMDPAMAAVAQQALPGDTVTNLTDLQNLIPLRKAYDAYNRHDYIGCLTNIQAALALNPNFPETYYGQGLCQAAIGQWNSAATTFESVKKMKWGNMDPAIEWALNNQKATAAGKTLNPKKNGTPEWVFGVSTPFRDVPNWPN